MPLIVTGGSDLDAAYDALLEYVKDTLDIPQEDTYKDGRLMRLVKASVDTIESETWRSIFTQTYRLETWDFHTIRFPRPPFISLTSVQYIDENGDTQTLAADGYHLENVAEAGETVPDPAILWFDSEVVCPIQFDCDTPYPVHLTYSAGYGTTLDDLPPNLLEAIVLLAYHRFLSPITCDPGLPHAVSHYLRPFLFRDDCVAREITP